MQAATPPRLATIPLASRRISRTIISLRPCSPALSSFIIIPFVLSPSSSNRHRPVAPLLRNAHDSPLFEPFSFSPAPTPTNTDTDTTQTRKPAPTTLTNLPTPPFTTTRIIQPKTPLHRTQIHNQIITLRPLQKNRIRRTRNPPIPFLRLFLQPPEVG